jgi:hypothetical protein
MIGKIMTGTSFYHCLSYCLQDKKNLSEEEKQKLSRQENLQHKERAEVLFYNSCFGDARELSKQFKDVSKLSSRVEKPVLHISLRLAPGETLSKDRLTDIAKACAEDFKFDQNQYICILHKDTRDQHIHIVANRVGYDGRAVSLSNDYRLMANFCRKMELKHELKVVLSPRIFLPKEQRLIPRQDIRKERLREHIRENLKSSSSYAEFEQKMKSMGYQVLKGRGISFIDDKKVKIKGSEVGFSLMKIEKILELQRQLKIQKSLKKTAADLLPKLRKEQGQSPLTTRQKLLDMHRSQRDPELSAIEKTEKQISSLIYELLKPEQVPDSISPELLKEARGRRKRHEHHL